jgi:hypothetical protein
VSGLRDEDWASAWEAQKRVEQSVAARILPRHEDGTNALIMKIVTLRDLPAR